MGKNLTVSLKGVKRLIEEKKYSAAKAKLSKVITNADKPTIRSQVTTKLLVCGNDEVLCRFFIPDKSRCDYIHKCKHQRFTSLIKK